MATLPSGKRRRPCGDAWEEWDPQFEEVIEIDPETILVVNFVRARGKGSGIPVEARAARVSGPYATAR
jgi:hypothetical protein